MANAASGAHSDGVATERGQARRRRAAFWLTVGPFAVLLIGGMLRLGVSLLAPLWPANLDPSVAITSTVVIVFAVAVGVWVYVRYGLPISNDYHRAFGEPGIDPASIVMGLRLIAPLFAIGGVVAVLLPNPASAVVAIGAAMAYRLILSVVLLLKVARA